MGQIIWIKLQKLILVFLLGLALNIAWLIIVFASEPGDLDTSFNNTGIITTSVGSIGSGSFDVTIQPDQKIIVVGSSNDNANSNFMVLRYNPDGSLDTNFNGGIVTTSVESVGGVGFSIALQLDNKIVVAGAGDDNATGMDFAVLRYNEDGSLDDSFGNSIGGVVTTDINSSFDVGRSIAIQSNGKIVVAGDTEVGYGPERDFAVVCYNQDGSLDTDFKGTGIVTTSVDDYDTGASVAIQGDDKIIIAGSSLSLGSSSSKFVTLRYTTTGELDTDFNGTGIVTTPVGSGEAVALQSDGKIVVAGSDSGYFVLVRYDSSGNLDTTLNGTGIVTTDISSGVDSAGAVAIQDDGKIVVAGVSNWVSTMTISAGKFAVVRYNSDGSLDTTFGNDGIITTTISDNRDQANAVAIQADGKIVVAGFENASENTKDHVSVAVIRYIGRFTTNLSTYLPVIFKE